MLVNSFQNPSCPKEQEAAGQAQYRRDSCPGSTPHPFRGSRGGGAGWWTQPSKAAPLGCELYEDAEPRSSHSFTSYFLQFPWQTIYCGHQGLGLSSTSWIPSVLLSCLFWPVSWLELRNDRRVGEAVWTYTKHREWSIETRTWSSMSFPGHLKRPLKTPLSAACIFMRLHWIVSRDTVTEDVSHFPSIVLASK